MNGRRTLAILLAAGGVAVVAIRHRGHALGHRVHGGILVRDVAAYDALSHRFLVGSLFRGVAADVATVAPEGARVLEVGCGPGHLSIRLAREHRFEVTGLDLDPAMIERANANTDRAADGAERRPSFLVGDVAALPFPDASFDVVVSTLSMHHWADRPAGLAEIGRVLRLGGRALIWDLRPGRVPFHRQAPDPVAQANDAALRVVRATPWRWPWKLSFIARIELTHPDGPQDAT